MIEQYDKVEIEDQIAELQQQQLKTIKLLENIQRQLSELSIAKENTADTNKPKSTQQNQELEVGDRVRILNPRRGQQSLGSITRITNHFVFIETASGHNIRRASKNVQKVSV